MIMQGSLASTHPHSCWCQLPGNLSKCSSGWEARACPLSCSLGFPGLPVLPSETRLPQRSRQGASVKALAQENPSMWPHLRPQFLRAGSRTHHVVPVVLDARTWQLEGTGLAEPRGVGPGEEPALPFPVRGGLCRHMGACPTTAPSLSPGRGPAVWPSRSVAYFSWVPSQHRSHWVWVQEAHPEAERPGRALSLSVHIPELAKGPSSAWPRHSSPCQLPSVP